MTKYQYLQCLREYIEIADCELFFEWLKENPSFMELDEVEIQINFMMYTVASLCFIKGYKHDSGNR